MTTHAQRLREEVETAPAAALPAIANALWSAVANGEVSEAEAEAIDILLAARRKPAQDPRATPRASDPQPLAALPAVRRAVGSRPRSPEGLLRRRRLAGSGALPPQIRDRFTLAEAAALIVVGEEVRKHGSCTLHIGHIAALAGVGETSVRNALREARRLGLVAVEIRRITGWRNDSNVVTVLAPEWLAWLACGPGGGFKLPKGTYFLSQNLTDLSSSDPAESGSAGWRGGTRGALPRFAGET